MTTSQTFTLEPCNLARLYADLAASFPDRILAISIRGDQVTVYLDAIIGDEDATLADIFNNHDPNDLTPDQQTEAALALDTEALLSEITTQRAVLQDALANWAALTQAEQIAVLRRDTAITDKMLGAFAYLLRHMALG